ncbi:DUF3618 domain-containing protein [Spirillospora sp. NPDC048911]|uniref:DUF3618 domain-containing protein n=1 Tax=Spirillospora sp. NPDC048911 TaxID=3364527 RepID=UPI00371E860A
MTDRDRELQAQRERTEQARNDLGETVGELASRADVKARAQQKAGELKERAREVTPDAATKAVGQVRKRPAPAAGGAAAVAVALIVARRVLRDRRAARDTRTARASRAAAKAKPKNLARTFRKKSPLRKK